ncbi:MAG TPA: uracil-DNA glycosylase, partial [Longimicrobium sp.]|nr:uracil-DNA glycosylase [Longimicrobium sp.]
RDHSLGRSNEHMSLKVIESEVVACTRCARLVAWREQAAAAPPRRYRGETYWARPIPGFGDPAARLLVLGLAPAAHGGNRTGRVFTGDRSGDWLFAALHRAGFANQPTSTRVGDGLALRDVWITAAVKCAPPDNKPLPEERDACFPFAVAELAALPELRAILCLGKFAWDGALRLLRQAGHPLPSPLPGFGHGAQAAIAPGLTLIGSYHPSQQNTFTGRLTETMLDDVFAAARRAIT